MRDILRRFPAAAAGTLAAALALPAAASAQQQLDPVRVTASAIARADSLHARAERHEISTLRDFRTVAHLHEQSAELRGEDDARTVECLQTAAHIRHGAGDHRRAADDMERAARLAAERGDVMNAAQSYIDAAYVAVDLKQGARVRELARAARLLTESPLITATQRTQLLSRIERNPTVAMLSR